MQAGSNLVQAEEHHAEKARFEKESAEHFVSEKRSRDTAGESREMAPVRAELIGHDDAGDDAHGEVDGEDLRPE